MPKVDLSQIEPCAGNPKFPCGRISDVQVKGYDGKWRCLTCNVLHTELVFKEAGKVAPNPGEATKNLAAASRLAGELNRRMAKAEKDRKAPERPVADESRKATMTKEAEDARRARILKKYHPGG